MKGFLKKQWKLIVVILIFYSVFFVYYNEVVFSQKLTAPPFIVGSISSASLDPNLVQTKINSPVRLKIPIIGVNAAIEYVGLTSAGAMAVAKDTKNVAWFDLGSFPGAEGSAVIAGHLDDKNGRKAVFYNLKKLNKGDQLFIEDSQGKIITFVVREIRLYDSEASAPEIFSSNSGQHLNLITCAGNWDKFKKRYTQRLVIFTDLK